MGIQTDNAERKWKEGLQDELIKLECLKLIYEYGTDGDRGQPWNRAQMLFNWVKIGKPHAEVK